MTETAAVPRVHFVTSLPSPFQVDLLKRLRDRGMPLFVHFTESADDRRSWRLPDQLPFEHRYIASVREAADVARHARHMGAGFVVVGGSYASPTAAAAMIALRSDGHVPWAFWGERPDGLPRIKRAVVRTVLGPRSQVLPISERAATAYSRMGFDVIGVIPYPVEPVIGLQVGRGESRKTVLYVGRFVEVKRPWRFIEMAAHLRRTRDLRFVMVGGGPLLESCKHFAESCDVEIEFVGPVDRPRALAEIRQSSMVVVPSRYEGWGMVVSEAVVRGVRVVAAPEVDAAWHLRHHHSLVRLLADGARPHEARTVLAGALDAPAATQDEVSAVVAEVGTEAIAERLIAVAHRAVNG